MQHMRVTTSIRFTADETELLDAWAAYLAASAPGVIRGTRSEAVRHLLRKATPPAKPGEHEARIRRAHTALYGEHP